MKRKKLVARLVFLTVIIVGGLLWWLVFTSSPETSGDIVTSGFIEAREVSVALEAGGRIVKLAAEEGDTVAAGVTLVELDSSLIDARKRQAEADLRLTRAYLTQAEVTRDGARTAWENTVELQANPLELEARITGARGEVEMAELTLMKELSLESDWKMSLAEIRLDTAEKALENFRRAEITIGFGSDYDRRQKTIPAEGELEKAVLGLAYTQAMEELWTIPAAELRVAIARDALGSLLEIRDNPQEINTAVDRAETAHRLAAAAVEAAQRQVEQAEAALGVIEVQMSRMTASSPISGVVSAQHAELGEIASPGVPVLTILELEKVTLTAYVPESKIGLIKLGQAVVVTVDSYPGESFTGEVVYISSRSLFTPKNIQLKEEREKMVFGVKISLDNPDQKLKPGTPADARMIVDSEG